LIWGKHFYKVKKEGLRYVKLLKDTFLFEYLDKSTNLRQKMISYNPTMDNLDIKLIEDDLNTIQKRFSFPLKNKVIDELHSKHRLIPIFNKDRIKIPTPIPAFLYNNNGKAVSLVNLTNYGTKDRDGEFHIDTRQLFAVLQTGVVALGCYENWNAISMNQSVGKLGALIYSKIFSKVLDKMFAINLDPIKSDKVKFITAKFFLLNILGKSNGESVNNIAYSVCQNETTRSTIMAFDQSLPTTAYHRLDDFINAISINVEGCHTLTFRTFIDTYIKMYHFSSIFALEYFPYFCHMLFSVAVGAHINSEYLIENLVGKDLDKFYNEVSNIIR
jgi:hypothetical protein